MHYSMTLSKSFLKFKHRFEELKTEQTNHALLLRNEQISLLYYIILIYIYISYILLLLLLLLEYCSLSLLEWGLGMFRLSCGVLRG